MRRLGIFIDVSNLYYSISKRYNGKLDYSKLMKFLKDIGDVKRAIAYGAQIGNKASSFIYCLKGLGFETKYKKPKTYERENISYRKADWDVGITIDVIDNINDFDIIILGTADGDLLPLVDWIKKQNKEVIIVACNISSRLKTVASRFIEIPESLLENNNEINNTTQ